VIGEEYIERKWRVITLMSTGELWAPLRDDIMFTVPNLAPADLATRCGTWEIARKETELHARVEILKRLRQIERAVEDAYTILCQSTVDVYSLVRSPNTEEWSTTTVAEVARIFSPKPTLVSTFATHKYLMNRPLAYVAHHDYRSTHSFDVRPQSHIDQIETIRTWSRLSNGPIDTFVSSARPVMALNKKIYTESYGDLPTQRQAEHSWTGDDAVILAFLLNSLRPYRSIQADPYSLGQSAILKKIDPHRPFVNDHVVHRTLVDLGVIAPWQDPLILSVDLGLDRDEATSPKTMKQNALIKKGFSSLRIPRGPLGPEDFYPSDPLDSVRHDFGDMPVYVIDDPSAEELDDGVAIEAILSEPGSFWVHIHVADPASTLPPTHVFSQQAMQQGESAYFIHRSWPMFPRSLIHSGRPGLSIGSAAATEKPERVITFSSKINTEGQVIDYNVRAGIINNICRLSYDSVDLAMGRSLIHRTYPFGDEPPAPSAACLTPSQLHDLRNLDVVANRLVTRRIKDGVFNNSENRAEIYYYSHPNSKITSPTLDPSCFHGFPKLKYSVTAAHDLDTGSRSMVAEMMKVACRAASLFCLDRGIPVLRRAGAPVVTRSESDYEKILSMRTPNGYVYYYDTLPFVLLNPAGDYTLEPKAHFGLGVPEGEGYVRTTSPLRRYGDLVSHWQIHHALLGPAAPKSPPFSAEWLEDFGRKTKSKDRLRKRTQGLHHKYWHLMYLKRWMEDPARGINRLDPLTQLEARTLANPILNLETRSYQTQVHIPLLGMDTVLAGLNKVEIPLGTTLPVKIEEIRLGVRPQLIVGLR